MTARPEPVPGRAGRTPGLRPVLGLVAGVLAVGCQAAPAGRPAALAPDHGSYPVATPPAELAVVPLAAPGHYRLVAAGDQVLVQVGGAVVRARMTGPDLDRSGSVAGRPPPTTADGVVTVSLRSQHGTVQVPAASFLTLGERRDKVAVRADRTAVVVAPGRPAVLHLSTRFRAGHATLTWQPAGIPLVTWDFVVELD